MEPASSPLIWIDVSSLPEFESFTDGTIRAQIALITELAARAGQNLRFCRENPDGRLSGSTSDPTGRYLEVPPAQFWEQIRQIRRTGDDHLSVAARPARPEMQTKLHRLIHRRVPNRLRPAGHRVISTGFGPLRRARALRKPSPRSPGSPKAWKDGHAPARFAAGDLLLWFLDRLDFSTDERLADRAARIKLAQRDHGVQFIAVINELPHEPLRELPSLATLLAIAKLVFVSRASFAGELAVFRSDASTVFPPMRVLDFDGGIAPRLTEAGTAASPISARVRSLTREPYALGLSPSAPVREAWRRLREEGPSVPKLVWIGATGSTGSTVTEAGEVCLPGTTDAELRLLYQHCLFTIDPAGARDGSLARAESSAFAKRCVSSLSQRTALRGPGDFKASANRESHESWLRAVDQICEGLAEIGSGRIGPPAPAFYRAGGELALVTLWTPEIEEWVWVPTQEKQQYCAQWGFGFYGYGQSLDHSRRPEWSKIAAVRRHLPNHRWLLWIDADTVITNPRFDARALADPNYDVIVTHDNQGFNSGVFLIQSTPRAREFIDRTWQHHVVLHHFEQTAMAEMMRQMPELRVKVLPKRAMNSYWYDHHPEDFVFHAAGEPGPSKAKLMTLAANSSRAYLDSIRL